MRALWLFIVACGSTEPSVTTNEASPMASSELPEPAIDLHMADGEMLRYGAVEGYRARRSDYRGDLAILVRADPRNEWVQQRARELAERPALVFVLDVDGDTPAAMDYLEGIPGITQIEQHIIEEEVP